MRLTPRGDAFLHQGFTEIQRNAGNALRAYPYGVQDLPSTFPSRVPSSTRLSLHVLCAGIIKG